MYSLYYIIYKKINSIPFNFKKNDLDYYNKQHN